MLQISVVDDELGEALGIREMIENLLSARNEPANITVYQDAQMFLETYAAGQCDILFLDIQMPRVDGMSCAQLIRQRDPSVILIFVTGMVQYAVQGYRVEALDYLVKPVTPSVLAHSLHRALKRLNKRRNLTVRAADGLHSLNAEELLYAEAVNHRVVLHTRGGEIHCAQTLSSIETQLQGGGFFRCHQGFLVNMRQIRHVEGTELYIEDKAIPVSKYRRRELMRELAAYWGDPI